MCQSWNFNPYCTIPAVIFVSGTMDEKQHKHQQWLQWIFKNYLLLFLVVDEDNCGAVVCNNGGSCVDEVNDYYCDCSPGYTGEHCETGKVDIMKEESRHYSTWVQKENCKKSGKWSVNNMFLNCLWLHFALALKVLCSAK